MKLACIGPLNPLRTGVADFVENLLPFLARRCEVKLFTDGYSPSPTPILAQIPAADISEFVSDPSAFDAVLYHMGNHYKYHRRVFETLWRLPGVVMLHDCVLNEFFAKYALERGNFRAFRRLLGLCYPDLADQEVAAFYGAEGDPCRFPMAGVTAMCSRGTIVMNEYARGIVLKEAPGASVLKISFPHFPVRALSEPVQAVRKMFNIPEECLVVTSIGHMTPAKRIPVALEAFRKFNERFPDSVFLLAGETSGRLPVVDIIDNRSLKNVRYLGYLQRAELNGLMEMADICINLRYPSNGEMSSTLINMLGRGKVVVVSNYAQFAEFPDSTCVKIDLGPMESDDLADRLLRLASDTEHRRCIGEAARDYIMENHSPDAAADAIVNFMQDRSTAEPLLTREHLNGLLSPDGPLRRSRQLVAYNTKRFLLHSREQGIVRTVRESLRRAFARTL
ncbi:MAG: glycosyltransferase family 4 protein [Candidatus Hydrogenedentota bacterium]|nr:MAG: glycosyltransferase family 4 protein [Candidatus Hydrogenedentota bacterium]